MAFMPVYIEKVEIWSDVTIARRTNNRTRKDRATQPMDHGRLRWAISKFCKRKRIWNKNLQICKRKWLGTTICKFKVLRNNELHILQKMIRNDNLHFCQKWSKTTIFNFCQNDLNWQFANCKWWSSWWQTIIVTSLHGYYFVLSLFCTRSSICNFVCLTGLKTITVVIIIKGKVEMSIVDVKYYTLMHILPTCGSVSAGQEFWLFYVFFNLEPLCDQTWQGSPTFSIGVCLFIVSCTT